MLSVTQYTKQISVSSIMACTRRMLWYRWCVNCKLFDLYYIIIIYIFYTNIIIHIYSHAYTLHRFVHVSNCIHTYNLLYIYNLYKGSMGRTSIHKLGVLITCNLCRLIWNVYVLLYNGDLDGYLDSSGCGEEAK